jgi:hypothetical protein
VGGFGAGGFCWQEKSARLMMKTRDKTSLLIVLFID